MYSENLHLQAIEIIHIIRKLSRENKMFTINPTQALQRQANRTLSSNSWPNYIKNKSLKHHLLLVDEEERLHILDSWDSYILVYILQLVCMLLPLLFEVFTLKLYKKFRAH